VSLLPGPGYDRWVDPTHLRAQALKSSMKPKGLELDIKGISLAIIIRYILYHYYFLTNINRLRIL
jgi:hypothetical protein